jgi:hypothetical protein
MYGYDGQYRANSRRFVKGADDAGDFHVESTTQFDSAQHLRAN